MRGKALEDANIWAADKSLSKQDYQFLNASQELEKQCLAEESRILAQANDTLTTAQRKAKRQIRVGGGVLICSVIGAMIAFASANNQLQEAQEGTKIERAGLTALKQFETKQIESLVTAMDAGQRLKKLVNDGRSLEKYPATSPLLALQKITNNIREVKQFKAHEDSITTVNWSHDGKYLITGSTDKTARIWDTSGKLIVPLKGHQGGVYSASFSRNDKHIITKSDDKTVRIWDFSGEQLAIIKHQEWVNSASFSPDGTRIITISQQPQNEKIVDGMNTVSGSNEAIVRIWDLSGNLLLKLQDTVNTASFSPDGKYILTTSNDKTARIWDTSGKLVKALSGHSEAVTSANWSPNGKYILTNSDDSYVWDISGKQIARFKVDNKWKITDAGFSADSQRIFVTTSDKTYVWHLSGRLIREIKNQKELNSNAEFSPDGKRLFTTDDTIKVWDIRDGAAKVWDLSADLIAELTGNQNSPRWSPDGKYIVSSGFDKKVRIWNLSDKIPVVTTTIKSKEQINRANWSPDGKYVVTSTRKSILVWDKFGKQLARFKGHSDVIHNANFSPDGNKIVTASHDKTARVWDKSGKQLLVLQGHNKGVEYATFSPNGNYILTTTYDKETKIWSDSGKLISTFNAKGATWSPNSKYIMAAHNYDGKVYSSLWNISGKKIVEFPPSKNSFIGASFSKDGERIIVSNGRIVSIWDTSGKKLSEIKASQDVFHPSFSPDGKLIIATSPDNKAIIWDTNGKQLVEIPHQSPIVYAKFSPDGKRILTASKDKKFQIWDTSGKQLAEYKYSSTFITEAKFSPDGKYILAHIQGNQPQGNEVLIWSIEELDGLLTKGCNKLKDYLDSNPQVRERLKVCRSK